MFAGISIFWVLMNIIKNLLANDISILQRTFYFTKKERMKRGKKIHDNHTPIIWGMVSYD